MFFQNVHGLDRDDRIRDKKYAFLAAEIALWYRLVAVRSILMSRRE